MSENDSDDGQVSEVQHMDEDEKDTPISPDEATAGYPDSETEDPDTGPAGPDANPNKGSKDT